MAFPDMFEVKYRISSAKGRGANSANGVFTLSDKCSSTIVVGGGLSIRLIANIPGDAEVVFEASPFNALRILVQDLQGGMARAGLEDGDLVRGMYDTEFESLEQVFTLYTLLKTSEEIPLIVERHGERRTVKVQAEPLRQQSEWGGDWIPTFVQ